MKIGIVGGGIIGLTSALYLKRYGSRDWDVEIVTRETTPDTTADGAAGIWGPYLLDKTPIEDQHRWALETHDFIEDLWNSPLGGVKGVSLVSSTRLNMEKKELPIWHDIVYGFRELANQEVSEFGRHSFKHEIGHEFVTYTLEPVKFLPYVLKEFLALGGRIRTGTEVKDLAMFAQDYDITLNCTGVWARDLVNDSSVGPLRGQVMRVKAPWLFRVVLDDTDDGNYIIPNQNSVVLGGTHQADWNTNPDDDDRSFIYEGAKKLWPKHLDGAEILRDWVGLRPGRNAVRIEREKLKCDNGKEVEVIHNYGHGGSGITIFWGCAKDVFGLVQEIHAEKSHISSKL